MPNGTPDLKPGLRSTTFWLTIVLEAVVLVNAALKSYGKQPINVTPELSLLLASGLAALYVSWRHWNRRTVNLAKKEIEVARTAASVESTTETP